MEHLLFLFLWSIHSFLWHLACHQWNLLTLHHPTRPQVSISGSAVLWLWLCWSILPWLWDPADRLRPSGIRRGSATVWVPGQSGSQHPGPCADILHNKAKSWNEAQSILHCKLVFAMGPFPYISWLTFVARLNKETTIGFKIKLIFLSWNGKKNYIASQIVQYFYQIYPISVKVPYRYFSKMPLHLNVTLFTHRGMQRYIEKYVVTLDCDGKYTVTVLIVTAC